MPVKPGIQKSCMARITYAPGADECLKRPKERMMVGVILLTQKALRFPGGL